jgi:hypothetical protein
MAGTARVEPADILFEVPAEDRGKVGHHAVTEIHFDVGLEAASACIGVKARFKLEWRAVSRGRDSTSVSIRNPKRILTEIKPCVGHQNGCV